MCCLGLDESDGASVEAIGSEESKWVCQQEVKSKPALDDTCEGGYGA